MAKGQSLDAVIAAAERIVRMWEANPTFSLGEVTLATFKASLEELRALKAHGEELRTQLATVTNNTDAKRAEVNSISTRAVSGVRAVFGPDSNQYEEVGGTRSSERKKPSTKKKSS
ncbi:MAG: hypothetical protein QOE46_2764 [Acidobacteriota bacterium]|jgi:hypothetical protein|nr:hypothetical protein [Acidobacteriota bacterium]